MKICLLPNRSLIGLITILKVFVFLDQIGRDTYRHLVRLFYLESCLPEYELKQLAHYLDIQWFDRDASIPVSYRPSIAFDFEGIKYTNPKDSEDFTVFCGHIWNEVRS